VSNGDENDQALEVTEPDLLEAAYDHILADSTRRLDRAKREVALLIANKHRLCTAITDVRVEITQWEQRAVQAEVNGEAALAQAARKQAHSCTLILAPYEVELQRRTAEIDQAKVDFRTLYDRLEDAKVARMSVPNGGTGVPDSRWINIVACFFEALAIAENPKDGGE
jgi:phage shock protein A